MPAEEDSQTSGPYLLVVRHLSDEHLCYLPWNVAVVIHLPLPQHRNVSPNPGTNTGGKSETRACTRHPLYLHSQTWQRERDKS